MLLSERPEAAVSSGFLSWAISWAVLPPCPRWALDSTPVSSFSNGLCRWMASKKDVLTQVANILFLLAFPCCITASRASSPVPAPAWCWGTVVAAKLKEGWRIRSTSSGWARTMALQEPVTSLVVVAARNTAPPADKQNWDTYLGQNKINVRLGSGLLPTVWIVPAYIKAALPWYC